MSQDRWVNTISIPISTFHARFTQYETQYKSKQYTICSQCLTTIFRQHKTNKWHLEWHSSKDRQQIRNEIHSKTIDWTMNGQQTVLKYWIYYDEARTTPRAAGGPTKSVCKETKGHYHIFLWCDKKLHENEVAAAYADSKKTKRPFRVRQLRAPTSRWKPYLDSRPNANPTVWRQEGVSYDQSIFPDDLWTQKLET